MTGTDASRMKECLSALERTERYVVLLFFADELTPPEISVVLNIALSRVTQIIERFRLAAARVLTLRERQRDAQQYVNDWLMSTRSAVV